MGHSTHTQQKVGLGGYLAFFITIILFSGMFAKSTEWWRVFDFTVLNGAFGQINAAGDTAVSFVAQGGWGQKTASYSRLSWRLPSFFRSGLFLSPKGWVGCARHNS